MPRKKIAKEASEPESKEQKQPPLSASDRRKEIAKGIALICVAVGFFVYGTLTMLYFGEIRVLIPGGRGSLGLMVSGPMAWLHYFFYFFFCTWIITISLDYIYGEDAKGLRDKVSDWSGMAAIVFYALSFMLFHLFGPDGEGIPRYKLFGYYYHLRGPALWSFYLFYLCVTVFIIALLPWKAKYDVKDKVLSITWKFLVVFLVTTSALTLSMDKIDAWTSKDKKALMDRGLKYETSSLEKCVDKNDVECVKLFLAAGMDINTVMQGGSATALTIALNKGYKDLVLFLLERKADVNKRGRNGWTPLQVGAASMYVNNESVGCHDDMVRLLIKNNADVNAKARDGHTALMAAAQSGCLDTAKVLVENKADVNAREDSGNTALLYAVERLRRGSADDPGGYALVKYLLDHGADPNVKNDMGKTPLSLAKKRNKRGEAQELVELLEQRHARE